MTKILITGGNGAIGSHLCQRLTERGDRVVLLDVNLDPNEFASNAETFRGDIRDYGRVKAAVEGSDAVLHLAAVSRVAWGQEDPRGCWETNLLGTVNVLEACRQAKSKPVLFYASSREVYGEPIYLPVDEGHPKDPKSVYGTTKLSAERACRSYSVQNNSSPPVKHVILRFSNVYGSERDIPERVIPKFMTLALRGADISLFGGDQILDFTFIDDTVSGILSAYDAALGGDPDVLGQDFHFVTGRGFSISELAALIAKIAESSSRVVVKGANGFDVRRFVGNPEKARRILGYHPKTPLEEGLKLLRDRIAPSVAGE